MIQPLDIKSQSFKKGLFGYKTSEVDSYVNTVYRAYDDLFKENESLTKKLAGTESSLQECRLKIFDLENQVNKIENVSSYGEDDNPDAKKRADQIIKNAEAAAAEIIAKAKEQAKSIEAGKPAPATSTTSKDKEEKSDTTEEAPKKTTFSFVQQPKQSKPNPMSPKPQDDVKESASSKYFKKNEEAPLTSNNSDDDDEIFVGEIEDARKPDRMMIGDGEEEEDLDFEFL